MRRLVPTTSLCLTFLLSGFQTESNLCAIGFCGLQFRVKQVLGVRFNLGHGHAVWGLRFRSSIGNRLYITMRCCLPPARPAAEASSGRGGKAFQQMQRVEATLADLKKPHSMEDNIRQWPK